MNWPYLEIMSQPLANLLFFLGNMTTGSSTPEKATVIIYTLSVLLILCYSGYCIRHKCKTYWKKTRLPPKNLQLTTLLRKTSAPIAFQTDPIQVSPYVNHEPQILSDTRIHPSQKSRGAAGSYMDVTFFEDDICYYMDGQMELNVPQPSDVFLGLTPPPH